jgi:hypothetical protein
MPFTLALLASLAGLAASGVGLGETLANRPSAPKMPTMPTAPPAPTPAQQAQLTNTQKSLIGQQLPNLQAAGSGSLSPSYEAQIAQLLAGIGGQPGANSAANSAVSQAFGLNNLPGAPKGFTPAGSAPSTAAGAFPTSPVNLTEFVNSFLQG